MSIQKENECGSHGWKEESDSKTDFALRYFFFFFFFFFFNPLPVVPVGSMEALDGRPPPVSSAG